MQVELRLLQRQLAGLDLGQVEDVADDARQRARAVVDLGQVLAAPGLVEPRLPREPGQAHQTIERRADLVAGVGQEGALGPVGRLGLVARTRQRLGHGAAFGHVLGNPDRGALGRVVRVDRSRQHAAGEGAAVLAAHRALELHRLAERKARSDQSAQFLVGGFVHRRHGRRLPHQLVGLPAEHLRESRVDELEVAVAGERDADRRVVEDRLALQPLALGAGHVAAVDHEVLAPFHAEARSRHQQREVAPLAVAEHHRQVAQLALLAHQGDEALARVARPPHAQLHRGAADRLLARPARQRHEGIVDHHVAAGDDVGEGDQVGAGGHHVRQQRLAAFARQLGAEALGLVAVDRQDRRAALGLDVDAGHLHRQAPAGRGVQPELLRRRGLAHRQRGQPGGAARGEIARAVAVLVEGQQRLADELARRPGAEQRQRGDVGVEHAAVAVQHQRRRRTREQFAVARLGGRPLQLGFALGRDVPTHAPVAAENAAPVEARPAGQGEPVLPPVGADAPDDELREGPARFQVGAQRVHRVDVQPETFHVPGGTADAPLHGDHRRSLGLLRHLREAQRGVGLPVPVRRHRQQTDESLLAPAQAGHRGVERATHQQADDGAGDQQGALARGPQSDLLRSPARRRPAGHFQRRQHAEKQALRDRRAERGAPGHQRCRGGQQHRHEGQCHQAQALAADQRDQPRPHAAQSERELHRLDKAQRARPQRRQQEQAGHQAAHCHRASRRPARRGLGRHGEQQHVHQRDQHADHHEQAHHPGVAALAVLAVAQSTPLVRGRRHVGVPGHPG